MKKILHAVIVLLLFMACNKQKEAINKTDDIAIITTTFGELHVILYDETPKHKENFLKLAREGFYDSTTFHRIIEGFMIQGGDPNSKDENTMNDGQGGPGYTIDAEFNNKFIHKKGALSAARTGDVQNPEKKSSGSQFYIVQGRQVSSIELDQIMAQRNEMVHQEMIRDYVQATDQAELLETITGYIQNQQMNLVDSIITSITPMATEGFVPSTYTDEQRASYAELGGTPFLDGNYTIFGEVIRGLAVIDSVIIQNTNEMDRPLENITMTVTVETMDKTYIQNEYGYIYEQ